MSDLNDADFRFTGFLAEQQARYRTLKGRAALEKERRAALNPVENQWRRMAIKSNREAALNTTNERNAA